MASQQWPVKTIGLAIPSMYLDKRLEDDKEYGLHLFKPNVDACIKRLDTKETQLFTHHFEAWHPLVKSRCIS